MASRRILIVGGSTRAAADSVRRAGWQPVCADLFADLDLRTTAEVIPIRSYPDSLPEDVAHVRADCWFYCGALENHPDIIERMMSRKSSFGPLLGTSPDALRLVRKPDWLAKILGADRLLTLDIANQSSPPDPDGSWLQKPLASAGGRLIRVWDQMAARVPFPEPHYFQRRAVGIGLSAIFRVENGDAQWLGASRELEPSSASHSPFAFSYCGSCGPLEDLPTSAKAKLTQIAKALADRAVGLRGLIGLDFRLNGDDAWLTEVNPRYTASIEVLELASGRSFLNPEATASQISGFESPNDSLGIWTPRSEGKAPFHPPLPPSIEQTANTPQIVVKQILYASNSFVAPDLSRFVTVGDPWQIPLFADIPAPGTRVESGWPICTVLATGITLQAVHAVMHDRLTLFQEALRANQ